MKVLLVNKFLFPNGGSETYLFNLGEFLSAKGHEVEYFGMEHSGRIVGNRLNSYTSDMDFHNGSKFSKITYPIKTVYSVEARRKLRIVLDDFKPDVCHLNNFNFQLTPSIILEIRKWEKATKHKCKIVYTAHDYQFVCPDHLCNNPNTHQNCEKCLGGRFINCFKGKCIHGSAAKSLIGSIEGYFWNTLGVYKNIDSIICCSEFMKSKLDTNPILAEKTVVMHNFVNTVTIPTTEKKEFVLYFGRFSSEKGFNTLVKVAKALPHISFIFAGAGPLESELGGIENVKNVGFVSGDKLAVLISQAKFTVCPSECYENCPFSVIESQLYGTPVIAADIGGIPELVDNGVTGELFESKNAADLQQKIDTLWQNDNLCKEYSQNCKNKSFILIEDYYNRLLQIYN